MTSLGLSSTSHIITFDQHWHHLYLTSAGGKDLCNDAQISEIGIIELEIQCMLKNAQKVEWKSHSQISCHYTWLLHGKNCPYWWRFNRKQAQYKEGPSLLQKDNKKRKRKGEKKSKTLRAQVTFLSKNSKFWFLHMPSANVKSQDSSGKKVKLSCCMFIFHQIKANLAEIHPENHQNVQKTHFW